MTDEIVKELADIAVRTAERLKYPFSDREIEATLRFTERKIELNGKGDDYIPILFENELEDYVMRKAINLRGEYNRCLKTVQA